MASNRIKGITIELDGDTKKLETSLSKVTASINKTQQALTDVEKLLKLDPTNTTLLTQKQELLAQAIEQTEDKLKKLEEAQDQVAEAFARGDIGKEQYQAFQREIEATRGQISKYQRELSDLQTEQERLSVNTSRLQKLLDATGKEVDDYADVLGSKLLSAIKSGTASSDQLKTAIEKIGRSATSGKADIKKLTDALDTVDDGQAIQSLIQDLNTSGDAAKNAADDIGQIAEVSKGQAMIQAAEALSGIGDKLREISEAALDAYNGIQTQVKKVNAYFGETGEAAEQSAETIQNVYASGVGDSLEGVADAVLAVKKNLGELDDTELENLAKQALTLEQLYGIDMNETLRGAKALMTQYGLTAQQAMDLIVAGTQNGLDKTNELGDNLAEYTGKFKQAGYSAEEYFQLLNNGLDNGAYNLDKVNDAINEVTNRLADGTIAEAIGGYSEQTQNLFVAWQNGEATQKQVIDSIVSDIANCTNQQQALNLATTAFGTMAEDGSLKFITALSSVGDTYRDVTGAAQELTDATITPAQEMQGNIRGVQQALAPLGEQLQKLANTILPPISTALQVVGKVFGILPEPIQNFVIVLGALISVFTALVPVIAAVAISVGALNVALLPIIGVIAAVAAAIAGIIAIIQNWGAISTWFGNLWSSICSGIGTMVENVKAWFSTLWTHLQSVWNGICNVVQVAVMLIGSILEAAWNIITLPFQLIWQNCGETITNVWNSITSTVSAGINAVWSVISSVLTAIQTFMSGVWDAISNKVSAAFNAISGVASSVWGAISNTISSIVGGIRDKVTSVFTTVSTTASNIFNGIKSTASTVWNGIKETIATPINAAVDVVKSALDKIKGFFDGLTLKFPDIKLPHFSITGKFSLSPPSVPKLSIDWYKEGAIMSGAQIFGMNGSTLLGGGEAGKEAILPLDGFYTRLESMFQSYFGGNVEQYLAVIAANSQKELYLDGDTLVGKTAGAMDKALGQIALRRTRSR